MDEGGYSWPEAILTLGIVLVIFGTLLPLASTMSYTLQMRKSKMYAAETALQGAIYFKAYGLVAGVRQIENVSYDWVIDGQAICVSYTIDDKVIENCVNK